MSVTYTWNEILNYIKIYLNVGGDNFTKNLIERNIDIISLPAEFKEITSIGDYAFSGCTNLQTITFKGKPTTIGSTAFQNCSNLITINVPWAEGDVAGAPWGATNATINYNYTGE